MQDVLNINLGSVQAPYWQEELTIPAKSTHITRYVFNSFNLLSASIPDVLEVTFGGAAVQSRFSAGMGYKLSDPVSYIQFFNTSDQDITIKFSLAIGDITDNRLTVSGTVFVAQQTGDIFNVQQMPWAIYSATSAVAPVSIPVSGAQKISILCTSGSVTISGSFGGVNISNLTLAAGQAWEDFLSGSGNLEISGSGSVNYSVAGY